MSSRTHEEYKENLGAYVLGALPELESELFERHLATCEDCRAEVEELRPVTGALARSVPQVEAPPELKESLMAIVNAEAAERGGATADPKPKRRWFAGLQPRVAVAMALGVLALGVVVGVVADKIAGGGSTSSTTVAAKVDRARWGDGSATLEVSGDKGTLELSGAHQPPAGRVYQLWYQHGKMIERGGTFRPQTGGSYKAELPVKGANAVMVTVEREGGAPAPTGPPLLVFQT
jgi:anti-sigma-K factor RskA